MKSKFLIIFLFVSFLIQAQNTSYDNDVKHFIEINGTMAQYKEAVNQLLTLFKEQYQNAQVKEEVWKEVETKALNSLDGLADDLVVVYKKYFTHDEIKELNTLYDKEVLQKFIVNVELLTEASQDPSIVWSRSLYNQLTDFLYKKGYSK